MWAVYILAVYSSKYEDISMEALIIDEKPRSDKKLQSNESSQVDGRSYNNNEVLEKEGSVPHTPFSLERPTGTSQLNTHSLLQMLGNKVISPVLNRQLTLLPTIKARISARPSIQPSIQPSIVPSIGISARPSISCSPTSSPTISASTNTNRMDIANDGITSTTNDTKNEPGILDTERSLNLKRGSEEININSEICKRKKIQASQSKDKQNKEEQNSLMETFRILFTEESFNIISEDTFFNFADRLAIFLLDKQHSSTIVERCIASEKWVGSKVFWRVLILVLDRLSLKTSVHSVTNTQKSLCIAQKILSSDRMVPHNTAAVHAKHTLKEAVENSWKADHIVFNEWIWGIGYQGGTDVYLMLGWLLYHVGVTSISITYVHQIDQSGKEIKAHMRKLTKNYNGKEVKIVSLNLCFEWKMHREVTDVLKKHPCLTDLKLSIIIDNSLYGLNNTMELKYMFSKCRQLKKLCITGGYISFTAIETVVTCLSNIEELEYNLVFQNKDAAALANLSQGELMPSYTLETLRIGRICAYDTAYMGILTEFFPNITSLELMSPVVDQSALMRIAEFVFLKHLKLSRFIMANSVFLFLVQSLPYIEFLSASIQYLHESISPPLLACPRLKYLALRGVYSPGFITSLLQFPLLNTLKIVDIKSSTGLESVFLSKEEMEAIHHAQLNHGCIIQIPYKTGCRNQAV
ncbi:hypothetical protein NECID01_0216 [Nematocida sp. AWRm77]|nr:hypothetical protein NECID01_0216 [Nematocida sp. AWRm77]